MSQLIQSGGVQTVPQLNQTVYLDFDGEITSYNGEILNVDGVVVEDSKLSEERIAEIVAALNEKYIFAGVKFVTERPIDGEYSTVYVGKTDDFEQYGNFAGLAETVDKGNANKSDNAFVMLDSSASNTQIVDTISHETDHLLGTLDHGGTGLYQYACSSHAAELTGNWNGGGQLWYIEPTIYPYGFNSCRASGCHTVLYYFDNISGANLTNGRYRIYTNQYVSETTIGNGAMVSLMGREYDSKTSMYYSAYADDITVSSGGVLHVGISGSATDITLHSSGGIAHGWLDKLLTHHGSDAAFITDFNQDAQVSGRIENFDFNGSLYAVGAQLDHVTVGKEPDPRGGYYYGYLYMQNGAKASDTTVTGYMYVYSGNSAVNTTVSGGMLSAYSGAVIDTLTMRGGKTYVVSGTVVQGNTSVFGGTLEISGMTFSSPLEIGGSGSVIGNAKAVISGAVVKSGGFLGDNGAVTYDTVVSSGGTHQISYLAETYRTTVSSGGSMLLYGAASNTVVDGGYLYEDHGDAIDYDTVLKNGAVQILDVFASSYRTQISSGAVQSVYCTISYDTVISSGGTQLLRGEAGYVNKAFAFDATVYGVQSAVSSAVLSNTTVYGSQYMGDGTSAYNTHLKSGGTLTAASGAYVNGLYVSNGFAEFDSGASMGYGEILSGGVVSNGKFTNLVISSGGYLKDGAPTAYGGGLLQLKGGGSATGIILDSSDDLYVTVTSDTLLQATDRNGSAYNISNGLFADLRVSSGYQIEILSDASAKNIYVASDGVFIVAGKGENIVNDYHASMYVSGGTVSGGSNYGMLHVSDGGVLNDFQNKGTYGRIYVSSGGTANRTSVTAGSLIVYDGGVANNTIGDVYISSGGTANSAVINSGDVIHVSDGGLASRTSVNSYGSLCISSGATANNTNLHKQGRMYISSGARANYTVVDSGSYLYISSGGTALNVNWTPFSGQINAKNGAYVTYTKTYSGVYLGSGQTLYSSAAEMSKKVVSGSMYVMSGGVAESTTVNYYGSMMIFSGGTANNTVVSNALYVSSGGTANSTTLNVNAGMYLSSGAVANQTTVNRSGYMYISSGATAKAVVENGGWVSVDDGANVTFASNTISGLTVSGDMTVHSNTIAKGIRLYYGYMSLYSGGVASNTYVSYGGQLHVAGKANYTSVFNGGKAYVSSGGSMFGVNLYSAGLLSVSSGGTVNTLFYNGKGTANVLSGGQLNSTTVQSSGILAVYDGGKVNNVTVKNDGVLRYYGGTCYANLIYGGSMTVESGAVRQSQIASAGGTIRVSSGGTASGCITKDGGAISILSGGSADDTKLMTNGIMYVYSKGMVTDTVTSYGARVHISGGTMSNTNFQRGTVASVYLGGTATQNKVDYGSYLMVGSGAASYDTVVSSGGGLTVMSGAAATNNEVYGTLTCNDGGKLLRETVIHGRANLAGNAIVTSNTAITFDVSGRAASAMQESYREAMLNSYYVAREADMTISVSADQAEGSYILANWAGVANKKTFTLEVNGTEVGTFSTTKSLTYDGKIYSLYCFDDSTNSKALTLKVCDAATTDAWDASEADETENLLSGYDSLPDLATAADTGALSGTALDLLGETAPGMTAEPALTAAVDIEPLWNSGMTTALPLLAV